MKNENKDLIRGFVYRPSSIARFEKQFPNALMD